MEKDFNKWNIAKKVIHEKPDNFGVHEREIWWVSLGLNIFYKRKPAKRVFSEAEAICSIMIANLFKMSITKCE